MKCSRLISLALILLTNPLCANNHAWDGVTNPEFAYRALYRLISGTVKVLETESGQERSFVECGTVVSPFYYLHLKDLQNLVIHIEHDENMEKNTIKIAHISYPHLLDAYVNKRTSWVSYCGASQFSELLIRGGRATYAESQRAHAYLRLNSLSEFRVNLINCGQVSILTDVLKAEELCHKFMRDEKTSYTFEKEES